MPADSPAARRAAANRAREKDAKKPFDFGKAIGIHENANIKDKIKKWQTEGGGMIPVDDPAGGIVTDDEAEAVQAIVNGKTKDKAAESPKPARATPKKTTDTTNKPATPTKSPTKPVHNKLDEDVRIASAPKKRVVSDSNWRKNKSPPKDGVPAKPDLKPVGWVRPAVKPVSPTKPKVEARPPPIKITPKIIRTRATVRRKSRPGSSGNEERPKTSGSDSVAAEKSDGSPTSPGLGDKRDSVRLRGGDGRVRSPKLCLSADDETPAKRRSSRRVSRSPAQDVFNEDTPPPRSPAIDGPLASGSHRKRRSSGHRREHSQRESEEPIEEVSSTERRRLRKKSYQLDVPDIARPPEPEVVPETPPKVFGNRIEAWLTATPDPFLDSETKSRRTSKGSASTSDVSRPKTEVSVFTESTQATEESILETPGRAITSKRRTRTRTITVDTRDFEDGTSSHPSIEPSDITDFAAGGDVTSSPTLKRRGAKRSSQSPTKNRSKSLSSRDAPTITDNEDDVSVAPSSSVDASTVQLPDLPIRSRPQNLALRRHFPSTGKRLSTIASVETFATKLQAAAPSEAEGSEVTAQTDLVLEEINESESRDTVDLNSLASFNRRGASKRKLASHADLISVLSLPRGDSRSIVSARSIRTNRSRLATATIGDLMNELASDEAKYMRELRTLVDGVIPVLLTCVLSKSDAAVAAGLFSRSAVKNDPNVTKPIVDMGVALERLKSLHRRIPKEGSDALLSWAQSAQRIYSDYVKAWRLGFQDVVVNLAPANDGETPTKTATGLDDAAWDEGMPRNEEGYVINGDGERVDVAFLLKRPLVRLKYLAKTFKGINHIKHSPQAEKMATAFQELVVDARKRSNEERARLEDEAASNIDPTRARDPRSLAPLAGVKIDAMRCVRARDYFDMHLPHSSGQEVDCRVELLIRDDAPGRGTSGDVLLCEIDESGRSLLFPPIQLGRISARNGDQKGEIIVMMRGFHTGGQEWNEVFSLTSNDEQAGFEWVQMLGLQPIPPPITEIKRERSFLSKAHRPTSSHASSSLVSAATGSTLPIKSRTPSPREVEVPFGEQANSTSKKWGYNTPDRPVSRTSPELSPVTPPSSEHSRNRKQIKASPVSPPSPLSQRQDAEVSDRDSLPSSKLRSHDNEDHLDRTPRSLNDAMMMAGSGSPTSLRRTKAKRMSRHATQSPSSPKEVIVDQEPPTAEMKPARKSSRRQRQESPHTPTSSSLSHNSKGFSVWMPSSEPEYSDESEEDDIHPIKPSSGQPMRPQPHRRASSVPSLDLPTIPKLRKTSQPSTPVKEAELRGGSNPSLELSRKQNPSSAPSKLQKKPPAPIKEPVLEPREDKPPPTPPHRSPSPATPVTLKASNTPQFTPTLPGYKTRRRSSSPLKHEYEPSTATESSGESEEELLDDDSITSDSSDDELEDDVPTPLLPMVEQPKFPKVSPPSSIYTLPNGTISPSQSASNTPYRAVPNSSGKASKAVASLMSWSNEKGSWQSLYPHECSIVVTPGKIEAYELTAAHSKPLLADGDEIINASGKGPLVCQEVTPLVILRKSTGLDITVKSLPTAESRLKSGEQILYRSRNPEECAALYHMINVSRCNNPTWLALQQARGAYGQGSGWAAQMDRQNAARTASGSQGSWWNLNGTLGRRSSYRASSTRAASISAVSDSSIGTMASAFSALKRFSGSSRLFNVAQSTISSRDSGRSTGSFDSGSSGTNTPNPDGTPGRAPGAPPGIMNTKIRLYERETSSKWRDMGSARLTIMLPDPNTPRSATRQGQGSPGLRQHGTEKRILIVGKTKGETLLDVTLSETCFERVARTGIAVSVWEDVMGPNGQVGTVGAVGGVSGARARVYMVQMKTERECAYSYSLLGKLRY